MPGTDKTIAFIGIGTMGWPMAANLVRAGYTVLGYDLDPSRRARFAAEFAMPEAQRLAEIGREADIVVTMLPVGLDVRNALLEAEEGGIAATLRPGSLVIDMSSAAPVGTQELGRDLQERGIFLIDAPVSGAITGAIEGTLTIMIGGDDPAQIERATPVLNAMGKRLFLTGRLGSGHAMKALNNFLAAASFAAASEAVIVGKRFGLDPTTMIDIVNVSTGRNFITENAFKSQIIPGHFKTNFALGLLTKDAGIAADLADRIGIEAPVSHLVYDRLRAALDVLGYGADHSRAFEAWEAEALREA